MAVYQPHHARKCQSGLKRMLVLLGVVVLLVATLSETTVFSDPPFKGNIVFSSNRDGDREIYVMDADGGIVMRLTNSAGIDRAPDWSPNGKNCLFERT